MAPKRKPMAIEGEEVPELPQKPEGTQSVSEYQRMKAEIEKISGDYNLESLEE